MVLLATLHRIASRDGLQLSVAHANHQLRGAESEADAALVTSTVTHLDLPFQVGRLPVREVLSRSRESIEMVARRLRHRFFAATAREFGATTVALGHHADDQVELILLRLLRGAGGEGLGGMAWSDPSPADPNVRLIRPLLDLSRAELAVYAQAHGIAFREDSSNSDPTIDRNRVRHELRPLLEREFNPALGRVLQRTAQVVGAEADFAAQAAERWLKSSRRTHFNRLHVAVQRAVVRRQLWALGQAADFDRVEQLRTKTGRIAIGPSTLVHRTAKGTLKPAPVARLPAHRTTVRRVRLTESRGRLQLGPLKILWRFSRSKPIRKAVGGTQERFDAETVGPEVIVRHWQPGDRFQPLGFARATKVQDLLVNRKIPAARRRELALATRPDGEVFWIEGLPPGERFKVTPQSEHILVWSWRPIRGSAIGREGEGK